MDRSEACKPGSDHLVVQRQMAVGLALYGPSRRTPHPPVANDATQPVRNCVMSRKTWEQMAQMERESDQGRVGRTSQEQNFPVTSTTKAGESNGMYSSR